MTEEELARTAREIRDFLEVCEERARDPRYTPAQQSAYDAWAVILEWVLGEVKPTSTGWTGRCGKPPGGSAGWAANSPAAAYRRVRLR